MNELKDELITVKQAKSILNLNERTIHYHIRTNKLKIMGKAERNAHLLSKNQVSIFKPVPYRIKKGQIICNKAVKQYELDNKNGNKTCRTCKENKNIDKFRFRIISKKYPVYCNDCKSCEYKFKQKYIKNNIAKVRMARNIRNKKRRRSDGRIRLDERMGSSICDSLNGAKNRRTWKLLVNYNLEQLINHLELNFEDKMSWDNFGTYWHIHHVLPKRLFKYDSPEHPEFKICWALVNLMPKQKIENISEQDILDNGKYARDLDETDRLEYLRSKGFSF